MKIDKIKNYNQKLLAVLGTVVLIIALIGLTSMTFFAVTEISRSFRANNRPNGILSDEKIEELQKEKKRKQLISYESPLLVDTLNSIYMIPVSHNTLKSAEHIEEILSIERYSEKSEDSRYSRQYYGDYNNLLIYDFRNENVKKLFNERVNFDNIQTEYFEDDILLLIKASTKDTYKDGVINKRDYKTLFLYSIRTKSIKEVSLKNADVTEVILNDNSKDLIVKFGIDHNMDGKFDSYTEPSIVKKYHYQSGELKNIISEEINRDLQMKLEGTKIN